MMRLSISLLAGCLIATGIMSMNPSAAIAQDDDDRDVEERYDRDDRRDHGWGDRWDRHEERWERHWRWRDEHYRPYYRYRYGYHPYDRFPSPRYHSYRPDFGFRYGPGYGYGSPYHDYRWHRGGVRVGPLRFYWR